MTYDDAALHDYIQARQVYEEANRVAKLAKKNMDRCEHAFVDNLMERKIKGLKLDLQGAVVNFYLSKRFRVSIGQNDIERTREWLVEVTGDDSQFVREQIHTKRLREWLVAYVEENGELDVPEHLALDTSPGITARGWKAASKGATA